MIDHWLTFFCLIDGEEEQKREEEMQMLADLKNRYGSPDRHKKEGLKVQESKWHAFV